MRSSGTLSSCTRGSSGVVTVDGESVGACIVCDQIRLLHCFAPGAVASTGVAATVEILRGNKLGKAFEDASSFSSPSPSPSLSLATGVQGKFVIISITGTRAAVACPRVCMYI